MKGFKHFKKLPDNGFDGRKIQGIRNAGSLPFKITEQRQAT